MLITIRKQLKQCREALSVIGNGTILSDMEVGPRTKKFLSEMEGLISILPTSDQPLITAIENQIKIVKSRTIIHPFAIGQLQAFLKSLSVRYDSMGARSIFISHSSKDKELIGMFVEKILRLGIGVPIGNVFCTSIETMGIKNGDDMREHIRQNILGCDFALLMISCSYLESSICLNEMGAIWSMPIPNVNVFLCPGCQLPESIGWLYEVRKADVLCNKQALDQFYETLTTAYGIERKVTDWGIQRDSFLNMQKTYARSSVIRQLVKMCKSQLWRA